MLSSQCSQPVSDLSRACKRLRVSTIKSPAHQSARSQCWCVRMYFCHCLCIYNPLVFQPRNCLALLLLRKMSSQSQHLVRIILSLVTTWNTYVFTVVKKFSHMLSSQCSYVHSNIPRACKRLRISTKQNPAHQSVYNSQLCQHLPCGNNLVPFTERQASYPLSICLVHVLQFCYSRWNPRLLYSQNTRLGSVAHNSTIFLLSFYCSRQQESSLALSATNLSNLQLIR